MNIKEIINGIQHQLSFSEYENMFAEFAATGQTSGPNQTTALIDYTKLNFQRSKRVKKTIELLPSLAEHLQIIDEKQYWILLTETWCGDAANSVPLIGKMAETNPNIELTIALRDSNLELMDRFLTNGGRSIPKLIVTNKNFDVLFTWGPRPLAAQALYDQWKNSDPKPDYQEFQITLQHWYMHDKGISMQNEILTSLETIKQMKVEDLS